LASIEFYVKILREFLLARFTLFVRTSENNWAVEVRFSEKKVRNAPLVTANTNVWITSQMMRNMKKAPKVH